MNLMGARRRPLPARFTAVTMAAGLICVLGGAVVLAGWWFRIEALIRLRPHLVAMNPMTATCFVMAGLALLSHGVGRARLMLVLGVLVGVVAALKLLNLAVGTTAPDSLLFADRLVSADGLTNRMAPNTAVAFLLASLGLYSASPGGRRGAVSSQACAFGIILIAMFALIGYAFGIDRS